MIFEHKSYLYFAVLAQPGELVLSVRKIHTILELQARIELPTQK
jgi:hypothetical protein